MISTHDDLKEIFKYHAPDAEQLDKYNKIRIAALEFAIVVFENASGPDRTAAIRKIREAVMTANASVALRGRY